MDVSGEMDRSRTAVLITGPRVQVDPRLRATPLAIQVGSVLTTLHISDLFKVTYRESYERGKTREK